MSVDEKAQVLQKVESSPGSKRKILSELGVSKSDCYRWRARARQGSLEDRRHPGPSWNRLSPQEESVVLDVALEQTDLSSRQLVEWITDNKGFSVSESTVYRLLNSQGLIKSPEMKMAAGKEFHAKATCPHQMWATDASYFRVTGWGFYYLHSDGRLPQVHHRLEALTRHDIRLVHRGGPGRSRSHRHDRRSMGASDKATL